MSYSFSVAEATKEAAKQSIADAFDEMVKGQPVHSKDRDPAVAAAQAFVDVLGDPTDEQEVYVNMHGSLGWQHDAPDDITGAGLSISASLRAKPVAQTETAA